MRSLLYFVLGVMTIPLLVAAYLHEEPTKLEETYKVVKVTTYTTDPAQTDNTPTITASGFKVSKNNPRKHRIIAVSRDLKKKLGFGKKVKLEGVGKYSGVYVVEDVMNKRFKNRVDILINPKDKPTMFKQARLIEID